MPAHGGGDSPASICSAELDALLWRALQTTEESFQTAHSTGSPDGGDEAASAPPSAAEPPAAALQPPAAEPPAAALQPPAGAAATPSKPPSPPAQHPVEVIDLLSSSSGTSSASDGSSSSGSGASSGRGGRPLGRSGLSSVKRRQRWVVGSDSEASGSEDTPPSSSGGESLGAGAATGTSDSARPSRPPPPGVPATPAPPRRPVPRPAAPPDMTPAAFRRQRDALARSMYAELNTHAFGGRLPADLRIDWNARLASTAGLTHYRRESPAAAGLEPRYSARIELSSKVLDGPGRLRRTLAHEMCHVAAWLVDHTAKPPHGPAFRRWAAAAMAAEPGLDVTTCHSYEIFYAYRWQCTNADCLQEYGRHSNSIDVSRKACGRCRGRLAFLGRFRPDGSAAGTPARARPPSAFSRFTSENFAAAKAQCAPGTPHAEVMKRLSAMWAAERETRAQGGGGGGGAAVAASIAAVFDELALNSL